MDYHLSYGVEGLQDMLESSSNTKKAFQSFVGVIKEISGVIDEGDKGIMAGLFRE